MNIVALLYALGFPRRFGQQQRIDLRRLRRSDRLTDRDREKVDDLIALNTKNGYVPPGAALRVLRALDSAP